VIRGKGSEIVLGGVEGFVALMIAASLVAVTASWVRLPYTLALLVFGLVLGISDIISRFEINSEVILLLFLPPLIFEAAFVLDLRLLWDVRAGVLAFALPGVIVAMFVGGTLVHWGLELPWIIALLFGAIVAATDPVAILATFRQLSVGRRFATLVEGESLFNDGVALALLVTLEDAVDSDFDLASSNASFLLGMAGGAAVGIGLGWVAHRIIGSIDEHLTEMTLSVALAYGAFLAADQLHLSGVFATIAAAMTLGHLGRIQGWVYSKGSEALLIDLWEFLAFVANAVLFLLIGLSVRTAGLRDHPESVLWGVAAALAGRALVAYGIGGGLDRLGFSITLAERHLLFWGGLRGAVALAAALSLPADFSHRSELLAMTYGAVLFTLLAQGLTLAPVVRILGLRSATPTASPAEP
jgi:Na+:H+ antiporter